MSFYKPKSSEYCYHICVTNITLSLEEAGNNFQHFSISYTYEDEYYHCLSGDATVTAPHKCPIIG